MNNDSVVSYGELQQFKCSFNIVEDRISLDFSTTNKQQCTLWLTRRLLIKVLPTISKLFSQQKLSQSNFSVETQNTADNKIEKRIELSDSTPQQVQLVGESENYLVTTVKIDIVNTQNITLNFSDEKQEGLIAHVSTSLFYALYNALEQTIEHSQWDINSKEKYITN